MGQLDTARQWLTTAFGRAIAAGNLPQLREMTLAEKDLEPMWKEIIADPRWMIKSKE
jgi:hypothetical protein